MKLSVKVYNISTHSRIVIFLLFILNISNLICSEKYIYLYKDKCPNEILKGRREKVTSSISINSALLVLSADIGYPDNNNKLHPSPDLYYLSGFTDPHAALLLIPNGLNINGKNCREILLINIQAKSDEKWHGKLMDAESAHEILGIDEVIDIKEMTKLIGKLVKTIDTLFISSNIKYIRQYHQMQDSCAKAIDLIECIFKNNSKIILENSNKNLIKSRSIKDSCEISLIKKAIDISSKGFFECFKEMKPDMPELNYEAIMEFQFRSNGACFNAFPCIIGSGPNSTHAHYIENKRIIKDNELVVMDCGAEYSGYCADISRTIPSGGNFNTEQKIIYNIVLEAADSAFTAAIAFNKFKDPHLKALMIIQKRLSELGIIKNDDDAKEYFYHGTSHYLGLDVHDVGEKELLEPGNIITIEPGIYIPENSNCDKKWWNIGVRIEDDILVTKGQPVNMSGFIPRTVQEIENSIKKKDK
ncbi:MAG: Xaa-Pro aminopeptidase [Candidatus Kapabacteria bacterium]|nr:Xaa-Pro aminopeptidase [Candidatus Kapabacteria bacterium]